MLIYNTQEICINIMYKYAYIESYILLIVFVKRVEFELKYRIFNLCMSILYIPILFTTLFPCLLNNLYTYTWKNAKRSGSAYF